MDAFSIDSPQSPLVEFRTPSAVPGVSGRAEVWIQEQPFRTHINLRGDAAHPDFRNRVHDVLGFSLPLEANTIQELGGSRLCWLGPDEWLLISPAGDTVVERLRDVLATVHHSIVDVSGGQTIIRMGGSAWRDVLASACPLDLHPSVFGPGACAQTVCAHANVLLMPTRTDTRGDTVDIIVRRSFADHLARWLIDAAGECGYEFLPAD